MIETYRLLILRLLINIEGIPAEPEFSGDSQGVTRQIRKYV